MIVNDPYLRHIFAFLSIFKSISPIQTELTSEIVKIKFNTVPIFVKVIVFKELYQFYYISKRENCVWSHAYLHRIESFVLIIILRYKQKKTVTGII